MAAHSPNHTSPGHADWMALAAQLQLEAEVLAPCLRAAAAWVRDQAGGPGVSTLRRVLDLGSGPGVTTALLAEAFPEAQVVAVDRSRGLLALAQERAESEGVAERVVVHVADLATDLGDVGQADVIWASMVLHHLANREEAIRRFADRLRPGGLLAIVEAGTTSSFLPDELSVGRRGLDGRLAAAAAEGRASRRKALPDSTESDDADIATLFRRAELEPVAERTFAVRCDPPLAPEAQRLAHQTLTRLSFLASDRLDAEDRDALAVLLDRTSDASIYRGTHVHLHIDRAAYLARKPRGARGYDGRVPG